MQACHKHVHDCTNKFVFIQNNEIIECTRVWAFYSKIYQLIKPQGYKLKIFTTQKRVFFTYTCIKFFFSGYKRDNRSSSDI